MHHTGAARGGLVPIEMDLWLLNIPSANYAMLVEVAFVAMARKNTKNKWKKMALK